jgi:serine/threonine-protein kinase
LSVADTNAFGALSAALADRYELVRELGRGGMATVYLARDVRHARQVAIKVLHPELAAVLGAERFLAEITTTANLQHPHILPLFDSGTADGQLFYVMPFVEGETLRARLDRETQLPIADAVQLAREVADALQYAHERGVIHRDIKPENILLQGGHALVADFGIALAVQHAGGQRMTQTGLSLGTPQYMAPEQAMGEKAIDARADIYALGAVTYEMLAGEPPFTGPTAQAIIAKVMTSSAAPLTTLRAKVATHIDAAVQQALEKVPADRWSSARAYADALAGNPSSMTANAPASLGTQKGPATPTPGTRWREAAAWTVAALAVVAALVVSTTRREEAAVNPGPVEFEVVLPDSMSAEPRGSNASVDLSPDGTTLVFQATGASGQPMLYTRRLDDREVRPIRGTEGGRAPVFTPDGKDVVFTLIAENITQPLRRVSVQGGVPRVIAPGVAGNVPVAWIDESRFVFTRNDALWLATGERGQERLLASPDTTRNHVRYSFPRILPGGTHALVSIFKGLMRRDSSEIGVIAIEGGPVQTLGIRGANARFADGRLFYVSQDGSLFAVAFDPRTLKTSGVPDIVAEGLRTSLGPGSAVGFATATNGTLVWLTGGARGEAENQPVLVTMTGAMTRLNLPPAGYIHPRVSPTGQEVLIVRRVDAAPDIWRFSLTNPVLQRVTTDENSDRPEWMPDGKHITFSRNRRDSVQLVLDLTAGAKPAPLFHVTGSVGSGDMGPPHGYGAFTVSTLQLGTDIWVVHADSLLSPRPLLQEAYGEVMPHISPDGRYIAYESARTGRSEVYIRSLVNRQESEVTISTNEGREPRWKADGTALYYRTLDSMYVAQLSLAPTVSAVSRTALFPMQPFVHTPSRSAYDVLPGNRGFLMLVPSTSATRESVRIIVRTTAADRSGTALR